MFWFFEKKPSADPPTEKQLRYAKRLGIVVTSSMGKADLSAAIADAERSNPRLAQDRERVKAKVRERKYGPEAVADEKRWNEFADSTEYMLAVYRHGKETVVDVLRVSEAYIDDGGKLQLCVQAPKLVKDRHIGNYLDWDKHFELPKDRLLHFEPLRPGFHNDGNDAYQQTVERGLKLAHDLQ